MRRTLRIVAYLVAGAWFMASCAPRPVPPPTPSEKPPERPAKVETKPWSFAALAGWDADAHGAALKAFQKSCAKILARPAHKPLAANPAAPGGLAGDWHPACRVAQTLDGAGDARAKAFFETHFRPFAVLDAAENGDGLDAPQTGLFTGYYVPELNGTWVRGGPYQTPLLARPGDLVTANLGAFDEDLGGHTVWGRVEGGRLVPYPDRRAIEEGALDDVTEPVLWVDSAVDAFFLHIQGSGQVRLADGSVRQVGFAGKNGRPYQSIGRILIDRGEIPAERLTMDAIRDWVETHPEAGVELLRQNPSYVFFKLSDRDGPIGAQNVVLTAERSLAVDRRFMPLGAPVWLETHDPLDANEPYRRLMVSQDTGGAIKGVVRGDIFFGAGDVAERRAGNMKRPGRYFILLPRAASGS